MRPITNPDETAFPIAIDIQNFSSGLTKREYFAALAMQGLMASITTLPSNKNIEKMAVQMADDLIKQLNHK